MISVTIADGHIEHKTTMRILHRTILQKSLHFLPHFQNCASSKNKIWFNQIKHVMIEG